MGNEKRASVYRYSVTRLDLAASHLNGASGLYPTSLGVDLIAVCKHFLNYRGGTRRQLALEGCKLFGESNMANVDCGSPDVGRCEFEGLPGSPHRPYQPSHLLRIV